MAADRPRQGFGPGEAPADGPSGEDICPECHGAGQNQSGGRCERCGGSGRVFDAVGGG